MNVNTNQTRIKQYKQLFIPPLVLFVFWLILTGSFTASSLIMGFLAAVIISWLCAPLLNFPAVHTPGKSYAAFDLPYFKLFFYLLWLLWEIFKADVRVALIVLNPKLPIDPCVVTFKKRADNPIALALLANSITITPGTVTVDIKDDLFTVHALTKDMALSLAPEEGVGEMPQRVGNLFKE
ncbi:MAG TPA: Na+/H+ antiporter subunit E [Clostridia bacterium]|jgi:multicomponent Na+:H+ antiporter subunit E|nr:Na+/H+ antiporter subunit E [Clostridia bacterium]